MVDRLAQQKICFILEKYDPAGLMNIGAPAGEYREEADMIYGRIKGTEARIEVQKLIQDVFEHMFDDATDIIDDSAYEKIAGEICDIQEIDFHSKN